MGAVATHLSHCEWIQGIGGLGKVLGCFPGSKHGTIIQHWHLHLHEGCRLSDDRFYIQLPVWKRFSNLSVGPEHVCALQGNHCLLASKRHEYQPASTQLLYKSSIPMSFGVYTCPTNAFCPASFCLVDAAIQINIATVRMEYKDHQYLLYMRFQHDLIDDCEPMQRLLCCSCCMEAYI